MSQISRRKFIVTVGASAAGSFLLKGCLGNPPEDRQLSATAQSAAIPAVNINPADAPEVKTASIGFIGQTDAAPIIIAKEKGFFAKYGLPDIRLQKQPSWAVIRDKLELDASGGGLDSAMVLSPMPYLMSLGTITKANKKVPTYLALRLNIDGQGITLANSLKEAGVQLDSTKLKAKVEEAKAAGRRLKFAHTFKGGTSDLMLRYWLAAGGIDPENDVVIQIVPGAQLVSSLQQGDIQGFCVGEPWHKRAINQKVGYTALITGEFWKDHPEKALAFRGEWADKHPKTAKAILMAIMEAQQWCDKLEHREEMAQILSRDEYAKVPVKDIIERLKGKIDYGDGRVVQNSPHIMRYWANGTASFPYQSHDHWFLKENIRWGMLPPETDTKAIIKAVNREDMWRNAAKALAVPAAQIPAQASRGVEKFFDGVAFNPDRPEEYLKSLKIKKS